MTKKHFIKKHFIKKHFIKKHICVLLIICLSVSIFAGCGKDKKKAESIETTENNTSEAENISAGTSDDNTDDETQILPGIEILLSMFTINSTIVPTIPI